MTDGAAPAGRRLVPPPSPPRPAGGGWGGGGGVATVTPRKGPNARRPLIRPPPHRRPLLSSLSSHVHTLPILCLPMPARSRVLPHTLWAEVGGGPPSRSGDGVGGNGDSDHDAGVARGAGPAAVPSPVCAARLCSAPSGQHSRTLPPLGGGPSPHSAAPGGLPAPTRPLRAAAGRPLQKFSAWGLKKIEHLPRRGVEGCQGAPCRGRCGWVNRSARE